MRFAILMEQTATGFSAHVPDLPGCVAAGESREETLQLIREAVTLHLDDMRRQGEPIPAPRSIPESIDVEEPTSP